MKNFIDLYFYILPFILILWFFKKSIIKFLSTDKNDVDSISKEFNKNAKKAEKVKNAVANLQNEFETTEIKEMEVPLDQTLFILRNWEKRSVISEDGKVYIGGVNNSENKYQSSNVMLESVDESLENNLPQTSVNNFDVVRKDGNTVELDIKKEGGGKVSVKVTDGLISLTDAEIEKQKNKSSTTKQADSKIDNKKYNEMIEQIKIMANEIKVLKKIIPLLKMK